MATLNETITRDFTLHDPTTGNVSDADFLPTCQVFENTTDIPIITPTVVKRVGLTGNYRVNFTLTAALGFEIGKSYNVVAQATVNGITAKSRIYAFDIVTAAANVHFVV